MAEPARAPSPYGPLIGSGGALALTLLAAMASLIPVGLAGEGGVATHLALAPLYAATIRGQPTIGPVGAFAAGLLVDVLTLAPLGVCAIAYVVFQAIASREAPVLSGLPAGARIMFFAPLAVGVAGVHVATMMAIDGSQPSREEVIIALAVTLIAYPAVIALGRLARGTVPRWRTRTSAIRG